MLNHNFLTCAEIKDLTVCIVVDSPEKAHRDLDLDGTMPNVELVETFSYATIYVQVSNGLNHNFLSYHTHTHTHTHTHGHTDRRT